MVDWATFAKWVSTIGVLLAIDDTLAVAGAPNFGGTGAVYLLPAGRGHGRRLGRPVVAAGGRGGRFAGLLPSGRASPSSGPGRWWSEARERTGISEVPWIHEEGPDRAESGVLRGLSPRLNTVLNLLLQGRDRKTIASHVGISIHTVHDYVKELYRRFDVHSQSELIRRFVDGDGGDLA